MFNVRGAIFVSLTISTLATLFSGSVWSQTPAEQVDALKKDSEKMRRLLIEQYSTSQLFGELLAKNSRIRGTARRLKDRMKSGASWRKEAAALDQLLFDLETKIEQANFQASLAESAEVSKQLGSMVSNINSLKRGGIESGAVNPQQPDPGSLTSVVETEFAPIAPPGNRPEDINSPLIIGSKVVLPAPPRLEFVEPQNAPDIVVDIPDPVIGADANEAVQLPDLTIPSPEIVEQDLTQTLLKPLTLPAEPQVFDRNRLPHLQAPVPLNYQNNVLPTRPRFTVPIQFEFHSFNPGGFIGYQPYGGYWGSWGFGGYGYGGRHCPGRW